MDERAGKTCAVAECEERGDASPLVVGTDPHREAIVCAEHRARASAGAPWFARELLGGKYVILMDQALPGRLVNFTEEDVLSSEGPRIRVLIQAMDASGQLSEAEFWASPGWRDDRS